MSSKSPWIMIPARGGSIGLPRKNVRLLAGKPLISHVICSVKEAVPANRIIVITDDDEIEEIAQVEGVRTTREPQTTGRATLDDVALKVLDVIKDLGAADDEVFLTIQATCPFIRSSRIGDALLAFDNGAGSVISVVDDRHLGWRLGDDGTPLPDYKARVNRQLLEPQFRETGAIIGCRVGDLMARKTRIVEPIRLIELDKSEALDIDDFSDWAIAEYRLSRKEIIIRADAHEKLGTGHVFRALAIAQELAHHNVKIASDKAGPLASRVLSQYPFDLFAIDGDEGFVELVKEHAPDLVIVDQLDTTAEYVRALKKASDKVITFEDQGEGAKLADLLVSDLYANLEIPQAKQLTGISNAILAPNFETVSKPPVFNEDVQNILVLFGGTDPSHLTEKTLRALADSEYMGECSVVLGPGFERKICLEEYGIRGKLYSNVKYLPLVMRSADLAISSAGRTITELTSLGIPVVCLCQNEKELTHTHASARYGVINLGLGQLVEGNTIRAHIEKLVTSARLRNVLRERALYETSGRKNSIVIERMLALIGWN